MAVPTIFHLPVIVLENGTILQVVDGKLDADAEMNAYVGITCNHSSSLRTVR